MRGSRGLKIIEQFRLVNRIFYPSLVEFELAAEPIGIFSETAVRKMGDCRGPHETGTYLEK